MNTCYILIVNFTVTYLKLKLYNVIFILWKIDFKI